MKLKMKFLQEDISFWVENLLDERSDYLTGQTIYVDGGWLV